MALTDLTIRLLLLFFPGIICFHITDALTVHKERKAYEVFLLAYIYGLMSYFVYAVGRAILNGILGATSDGSAIRIPYPGSIGFATSLTDQKSSLDFLEIGLVTLVAVALAMVMSYVISHKLLHKLSKRLGISNKFGDPDVWSFAFSAAEVKWATVRDLTNGFMFNGYIEAYSDVEESAELLLSSVEVYNEKTGELLYEADRMYISRKKDDLTIELPTVTG